jgi:hypothetical protein
VIYSMWYNSPKLLSVGCLERGATALQTTDRQQFGCIVPHAVSHSLTPLRMGQKLPETCRADWKINKLLLLQLVAVVVGDQGPELRLRLHCGH